jgi:hypothetical protein
MKLDIEVIGLKETLRAFNRYGKEANGELRDAARKIADVVASRAAAAGRADSRQSAAVAGTVRSRRDRVPVIVAGGAKKVTSSKAKASDVLFGAEFGSRALPQFRPHRGRQGYWLWPTIRANLPDMAASYERTLVELSAKWGASG